MVFDYLGLYMLTILNHFFVSLQWQMSRGSPILKMFHNPGGDEQSHPGRGDNPNHRSVV